MKMKIKILTALLLVVSCASAQTVLVGNYIKARTTGGTPPYTYSLNNMTYQTSDTFKYLTPNTYTIYVKDSRGCIKTSLVKLYSTLKLFVIDRTTNSIEVQASGGVPLYSGGLYKYYYSINNGAYVLEGKIFTGLTSGIYTIKVKDSKGYITTITVTI
jgi:hypothetical protein